MPHIKLHTTLTIVAIRIQLEIRLNSLDLFEFRLKKRGIRQ